MFLFNKQDPLSQPHFPIYSEPPTTSPTFQIITSKFIITAKVKHYYPKVNSCPLLLFVPYMYHLTKTKSAASFAVAIPPVSFSRNRATILLPRCWRWGPDQEVWTICANLYDRMNSPIYSGCRSFNFHSFRVELILLRVFNGMWYPSSALDSVQT